MPDSKILEAEIMRRIQLAATAHGARLLRNNVGQAQTADGRVIRFGLANPGGSDLIGWQPLTITREHMGMSFARFIACEVKRPGGKPTAEQFAFLDAIRRAGGLAIVAHSEQELIQALGPAAF